MGSALLSLAGAGVIMFSALRFRELSKRFFAIRLIFFLALTDSLAATFHLLGAFLEPQARATPAANGTDAANADAGADGALHTLCEVQAVGLLYFNLASIG